MSELSNEQINRLIHEKVLGLCWHEKEVELNSPALLGDYVFVCYKCEEAELFRKENLPNYCGSYDEAFQLFEKINKKYYFESSQPNGADWTVILIRWKGGMFLGVDKSLPKAICLAILKAEGVTE